MIFSYGFGFLERVAVPLFLFLRIFFSKMDFF